MRYRLVIFDFDGTLADSAAWFAAQLPGLATAHGFRSPTEEDIVALRRLPTREVLRRLNVNPLRLPAIAMDLRRRMADDLDSISLFNGVPETIEALRDNGVRIGVVSSNAEQNIRRVLGGSAGFVSYYQCGASLFGKAKKFGRLIRAAGVEAHQACAVGDELRDIAAARAAGIDALAVTWGYAPADVLVAARPDGAVGTIDELTAFLTRHG